MRKAYKILPLLFEFRELDKRKTSYGSDYCKKYCNPITGRIHADFDPQGTKTARFSNNKPNLQQIPTLPEYRQCFVAPLGYVFVGGDFSQIELRIAAELSGDPKYLEAFSNADTDFHGATAEFMFGVKPGDANYKHMRDIAKRINFGIIYGMAAGKLAMQTDLPENKDWLRLQLLEAAGVIPSATRFVTRLIMEEEMKPWDAVKQGRLLTKDLDIGKETEEKVASTDTAQDYLDQYYTTFERLMEFLKDRGRETANNAEIRMLSGRLVKFWVNRKERWSIGQANRNGMNTPIQGLAGEILKLAMRKFFDRIYEANKIGIVKMVLTMHDELQCVCPESEADWTKKNLEESMVEAGQYYLKVVPVKVSLEVKSYWAK
jgi:DNA polymerase I-like protein with 3'-5' exonuclease and polymerase domains